MHVKHSKNRGVPERLVREKNNSFLTDKHSRTMFQHVWKVEQRKELYVQGETHNVVGMHEIDKEQ